MHRDANFGAVRNVQVLLLLWLVLVSMIWRVVWGSVPREAQLPRAIQRQRWSPVNVPLLWGAASAEETVPVLDWLVAGATTMDEAINFHAPWHDQSSGRCENRMGFFEGSDEVMGPKCFTVSKN